MFYGNSGTFMVYPIDTESTESTDASQWWLWTLEWQAKECKADADLAAGRYKTLDTMDEFLADLDSGGGRGTR